MKHVLLIAACAASLAGNASATNAATSVAQDVSTNREVGVASPHGQETACPALQVTDPVVARAVATDRAIDLKAFPAHLNGSVWLVSRDPEEILQGVKAKKDENLPSIVSVRDHGGGKCGYFYKYVHNTAGTEPIAALRIILLQKL